MKRILIPFLCVLITGCVTNSSLTTGDIAKEYLELWMSKNYPAVTPEASGIYIVSEQLSGGEKWSSSNPWIFAEVTIRTLSGTVSSSDNEDWAKQLGSYQPSYYYGGKFSMLGEGVSYAGVDAMLEGMELGSTRTAVIPAWMLTTNRYSTQKEYLENCTTSSSLVYTIKLLDQGVEQADIEKRQVANYINAHFPGATATVMPGSEEGAEADGTFWFISNVTGLNESDKRTETDESLSLNYTGIRLDGTVFDTSVKKTAIDNDVYNEDGSYSPLSVTYASEWDSILINGSTSFVDGFRAGVSLMWWPGQKATVIFTSAHGYGSTSKSAAIPAYCPMIFELELVPNKTEE